MPDASSLGLFRLCGVRVRAPLQEHIKKIKETKCKISAGSSKNMVVSLPVFLGNERPRPKTGLFAEHLWYSETPNTHIAILAKGTLKVNPLRSSPPKADHYKAKGFVHFFKFLVASSYSLVINLWIPSRANFPDKEFSSDLKLRHVFNRGLKYFHRFTALP